MSDRNDSQRTAGGEAKFFRKSTSNAQQNTGALLADLIRLLALVPNKMVDDGRQKRLITGRYLLHVYESFRPTQYLSFKKQTGHGTEERKWLQPLIAGGPNKCSRINLGEYETDGVLGEINVNLGELELEFEATTWRVGPTYDLGLNARQYVCILSRIDAFTLWRNNAKLTVRADRSVRPQADWNEVKEEIREHVGKWVSIKGDTERQKPDISEAEGVEEEETE